MAKRYDQYCPVAHALGLVGERWALLIVRELLHGPQRYTDLTANLPKIGTNPTGGSGQPTDQRSDQALLDYLMGK